jgi:hypothetical protein
VATGGLVLCWLTLRLGLLIRDARVKRAPTPEAVRGRHLRLALPAVLLVVASFPLGLVSAVFVRDLKPLHTAHGWLGAGATLGFVGAAVIGRGLAVNPRRRRGAHVALSLLGLFLSLLVAFTGIELLP